MDFRSDTVTKPSQAMREAMANAVVGDDVYGDDPTVNELEQWAAKETGFEAAMFTSSGTQANLLGLMHTVNVVTSIFVANKHITTNMKLGGRRYLVPFNHNRSKTILTEHLTLKSWQPRLNPMTVTSLELSF